MSEADGPGEKVGGEVGGEGGGRQEVRSRRTVCGGMMVMLPYMGTTR